ncbi:hypothetical protein Pint_25607 [Pistacia integerrima]|uniref:Uncharacterized protein n=1 Tax=Pistacia integerrima TaxID=434235 RepID=A0ACC0YF33_9ROSI|nr:hypothetical protein Pint_25607 [Pistacia integerrima]
MSNVGIVSLSSASAGSSESYTTSLKCLPVLVPSLLHYFPIADVHHLQAITCRCKLLIEVWSRNIQLVGWKGCKQVEGLRAAMSWGNPFWETFASVCLTIKRITGKWNDTDSDQNSKFIGREY